MSNDRQLDEPSGRAVAAFNTLAQAVTARGDLATHGFRADSIDLLDGNRDADEVDTAPKWFGDTDVDLAMYRDALQEGGSVVSVDIGDDQELNRARAVFENAGAKYMTHFGTWLTTSENLSGG